MSEILSFLWLWGNWWPNSYLRNKTELAEFKYRSSECLYFMCLEKSCISIPERTMSKIAGKMGSVALIGNQ